MRAPADGRLEDGQVDGQHRPGRRGPRGRRLGSGPAPGARSPSTTGPDSTTRHDSLAAAGAALDRLDAAVAALGAYVQDGPDDQALPGILEAARADFGAALDDDLNVSAGLAVVFDLIRDLNRRIDARSMSTADAGRALETLRDVDRVLAILPDAEPAEALDPAVASLLEARVAARAARDFAASDRLRDELAAIGVTVEDTRDGQRWRRTVEVGRG